MLGLCRGEGREGGREVIDQAWNTTTGVQTLHGYRLSLSICITDGETYLRHYAGLSSLICFGNFETGGKYFLVFNDAVVSSRETR